MTHPIERLNAMHDFEIDPPNSIEQVQAAIDAVAAKKAEYVEKSKSAPKAAVRVYRPLVARVNIRPKGDKDITVEIQPL